MNKKEESKKLNYFEGLVLIFWSIGNLVIFSGMIYLSYVIIHKEINIDVILITIIMLFWVIGQTLLPNFIEKVKNK